MLHYAFTRDPGWLDHVVIDLSWVVHKGDVDPDTRVHAMHQLGQALTERYARRERIGDLEWGARYLSQVEKETPADHPDRPMRLSSLAHALIAVVELFPLDAGQELAAAHMTCVIRAMEECLKRSAPGDPRRPRYLNTIGIAYSLRAVHTGSRPDLLAALSHLHQALRQAPDDDPELITAIKGNLGTALLRRFETTGHRRHLDLAAQELQSAIRLSSPHSAYYGRLLKNLAVALAEASDDDEAVLTAFRAVEATGRGLDGSFSTEFAYRTATARWAARHSTWGEAVAGFKRSERHLEHALAAQVGWRFKSSLLAEAAPLAGELAYALVRVGDVRGAVEALDRGRNRLIDGACRLMAIDPQQIREGGEPELADRLARVLDQVRQSEQAMRDPQNIRFELASELDRVLLEGLEKIVGEVRRKEGLADFARTDTGPPDPRHLRRPIVYLLAAESGGLALLVTPDGHTPLAVELPLLTRSGLAARVTALNEAYAARVEGRPGWLAELDGCCAWLWEAAMGAVVEAVKGTGSTDVTLVACGWTGLLPLHAAWTKEPANPNRRRYVVDELSVSYAPSMRHVASPDLPPAEIPLDRVLIVQDHTPGKPGLPSLPAARAETEEIRRLIPSARILSEDGATVSEVLRELPASSLIHLACHGRFVPGQGLESELVLAQGGLRVLDLLGQRLGQPRLMVLSACETARVGNTVPDELVGLPATFLGAGAHAVIATLWAVPDEAASVVMRVFYRLLVEQEMPAAVALRHAQIWVRDATNAELVDAGLRPETDAAHLGAVSRKIWESSRRFGHPTEWAAFTYTGV